MMKRIGLWRGVYFGFAAMFFVGAFVAALHEAWLTVGSCLQSSVIVLLAYQGVVQHWRISRLERERLQIPSITLEVTNNSASSLPFTAQFIGSEKFKN